MEAQTFITMRTNGKYSLRPHNLSRHKFSSADKVASKRNAGLRD
jgi:hypothetical protein